MEYITYVAIHILHVTQWLICKAFLKAKINRRKRRVKTDRTKQPFNGRNGEKLRLVSFGKSPF